MKCKICNTDFFYGGGYNYEPSEDCWCGWNQGYQSIWQIIVANGLWISRVEIKDFFRYRTAGLILKVNDWLVSKLI